MPHFTHTPEALLGRNDSKNPSTTCKGITSSGRACRRALASPKSSPNARRRSSGAGVGGVVALVQEDGELQEADFYCWQHKDQAEERVKEEDKRAKGRRVKRRSTELFPLQERSSIDTLMQRLEIDQEQQQQKTSNPKPPKKTATTDFAASGQRPTQAPYAEKYNLGSSGRPQKKKQGFWASLCCLSSQDDDYVEIVRHRKRIEQSRPTQAPIVVSPSPPRPGNASIPLRNPVQQAQPQHAQNAQTNNLLSLIPPNTSPQTASALLAELTKPISPYDEEGYIYIFWLTPQSKSAPSETTARSLLAPSPARPQHARRISDVMTEYSYDGDEDLETPRGGVRGAGVGGKGVGRRTIMLKIGRANNVTRRMNEWQRQCGYALNLVRWYPYVSSSTTPSPRASPSPKRGQSGQQPGSGSLYPDLSRPPMTGQRRSSDAVHKVPNVKRVERLIHLELAEKQVKRQCAACGKEHREWFEVEANQAGVKAVDETVRRWVGWAERHTGGG